MKAMEFYPQEILPKVNAPWFVTKVTTDLSPQISKNTRH